MAETKQQYDNNNKGALWAKESDKGIKYFSGYVIIDGEKIYISAFKNKRHVEGDNLPAIDIVVNKPATGEAVKPAENDELPF